MKLIINNLAKFRLEAENYQDRAWLASFVSKWDGETERCRVMTDSSASYDGAWSVGRVDPETVISVEIYAFGPKHDLE